jgi:hypothetical protein
VVGKRGDLALDDGRRDRQNGDLGNIDNGWNHGKSESQRVRS